MYKIITGGCSFTAFGLEESKAWPYHIELPNMEVINYAEMASGNALISRNLLYGINEELKTTKPNKIIVIVMWSNPNRFELFLSKNNPNYLLFYEKLNREAHFTNRILMGGKKLNLSHPDSNWFKSGGGFGIWKTDSKILDEYIEFYFKNIHDEEYQMMESLEHMLRIQWCCKSYGIKLINMTWMNIFTDIDCRGNPTTRISKEIKKFNKLEYPNMKHLPKMIDWDTWWFHNEDGGLGDWCQDNFSHSLYEYHPTSSMQRQFAKDVVEPMIKNL